MDKTKKVAFFTNALGCGGTERVISRLAPSMEEESDFSIIVVDDSQNAYDCKSEIIGLGGPEEKNRFKYLTGLIKRGRKLGRLIKNDKYDCVISFLSVPCLLNMFCNKTARKVVNIRCQLDNGYDEGILAKIKYHLCKITFKKADAAIVPTKFIAQDLYNRYKVSKDRINIIYNPFDIEEIIEKSKADVDSSFTNLLSDNKVITTVGRLSKDKGYTHLVRAFQLASQKLSNIRLYIIGDGEERQNIQKVIDELNVNDKVILAGKNTNPFPYIARSDLFISSSVSEGFPNALVEAMGSGTAVISTDCKSGPREILCKDGDPMFSCKTPEYADYGVLVPCFDNDGDNTEKYQILSEVIVDMLSDDEKRNSYCEKARLRAEDFRLDKCVKAYSELIGNICK